VIGKAAKEARQMRQNWLGAEHYLLAVLAEPGVATDVMAGLGVTHEGVAGQLDRMNTSTADGSDTSNQKASAPTRAHTT
jgi:ATP-dependent Clp protease ATP-binding subunit ClpA